MPLRIIFIWGGNKGLDLDLSSDGQPMFPLRIFRSFDLKLKPVLCFLNSVEQGVYDYKKNEKKFIFTTR